MEFKEFGKIPRLFREVVVTEKIDGTNAQIFIEQQGLVDLREQAAEVTIIESGFVIRAGSRNRFLTPVQDNYGFWAWVYKNRTELLKLGPGHHYGEWWGTGIQKRYTIEDRRFSLFNVSRWNEENKPSCCHVVPVICKGEANQGFNIVDDALRWLKINGSAADPNCKTPEGVIAYHTAGNFMMKVTLENDGYRKGQV